MPCRDAAATHQLSRREALQIGVGMFGLGLPQYLRAAESVRAAARCLVFFIFLAGGASTSRRLIPSPMRRSKFAGCGNRSARACRGR